MALTLAPAALDTIRRHAARAHPEECCGLLLGEAGVGSGANRRRVTAAVPVDNRAAEPRCGYELDPASLLRHLAAARRGDASVLGTYHSHPGPPPPGAPHPSRRDSHEAWPGWSYLIVAVAEGEVGEARSFRRARADGPLREERVELS